MENSKKILVSVLGTGNYQPCIYEWNGVAAKPSKFVVKALKEHLNPDLIYIIMTEQSKQTYYNELKQELGEFECVLIPMGKNEDEIYKIFETLIHNIPENSQLDLDVTHGFRSLPIIILPVVLYLQINKSVTLNTILYGAFEARDVSGKAPIFDLTPFLHFINWSYATKSFRETGDGSYLADILHKIQNQAYIQKNQLLSDGLPTKLKTLGNSLMEATNALKTIRIQELMELTKRILRNLEDCKNDIQYYKAKPLDPLLKDIHGIFKKFDFEDTENPQNIFKAKIELIQYYLNTKNYQQAITVAREAIITYFCIQNGLDIIEDREKVENAIQSRIKSNKVNEKNSLNTSGFIPEDSISQKLVELYQNIGDFRNDLNHAGMRKQPTPSISLINSIKDNCNKLSSEFGN